MGIKRVIAETTLVNVRQYSGNDFFYIGRTIRKGCETDGIKNKFEAKTFGNPYSHQRIPGVIKTLTRAQAVMKHMRWLRGDLEVDHFIRPTLEEIMTLKGLKLGCYCAPQQCHGDNYLLIIERGCI